MPNIVPIECLQSARDRFHDRYLHYSLVRMAILAFLVPMGGMFMVQPTNLPEAGSLLIIVAVMLNLIFGMWSLKAYILYEQRHDYLKLQTAGSATCTEPPDVKTNFACSYFRAAFGLDPVKNSTLGEAWKGMEPVIQSFVLVTIGLFMFFAGQPLYGWIFVAIVLSILLARFLVWLASP